MRDVDADLVVLGAGAAGSSLVLHLAAVGWDGSLLLVDDGSTPPERQAWAWWSTRPGPADPPGAVGASRLRVAGDGWARTLDLGPYRYRRTTGHELAAAVDAVLAARPAMSRRRGHVTAVRDDGDAATVTLADGATLRARWVFDGRGTHRGEPDHGPHLDVGGLVVECAGADLDPDVPVLMDFRTPQDAGAAFCYVLPLGPGRALVEHTRYVVPGGVVGVDAVDHEAAVRAYLREHLGADGWTVVGHERGTISLERPARGPRRGRVVPVGARGGAVRASTGYGFAAVQRHTAQVAGSLVAHGHPHAVRHPARWYRLLDGVLLAMLRSEPGAVPDVMARLFTRNPPERVLRFLDEDLRAVDHVRLYLTLPVPPFARAARAALDRQLAHGIAQTLVRGVGATVGGVAGRLRPHAVEPDPVDRLSAQDRVQLATDVGPVPLNVGAVLVLGPRATPGRAVVDPPAGAEVLATMVAERLAQVPRLRSRLVGRGRRAGWQEDPAVDARSQVAVVPADEATGVDAVLDVAARLVAEPLPRTAPLWRAAVVTRRDGTPAAVVVVLHHVLADGIGGLALLGGLVDPVDPLDPVGDAPAGGEVPTQRPDPTSPQPPGDTAAAPPPAGLLARLRHGAAELGKHGPGAPRTSLTAPTGPRRRVRRVAVDLAAVRGAARAHGATVNDLLLVAVTGALGRVLAARGERPEHLVVSVPVAARTATTSGALGNQVGVMPVAVPLRGSDEERLRAVAATTSSRRRAGHHGASAALVGPAFTLLARLGLFRWFVDRQRLVTTFLSNLRGPVRPVALGGHRVTELLPVTVTAGNVGVAFAALSSAGTLAVSVITDPDVVPEGDAVVAALTEELARLAPSADGAPG